MVRTIRHKGLKRIHEEDDSRGVMGEHAVKLRDSLARLDAARSWRMIFRFADPDVFDVDYVDYHRKDTRPCQ